jgi:hypothetical protein
MISIGIFLLIIFIIVGCAYWYSQEQKSKDKIK